MERERVLLRIAEPGDAEGIQKIYEPYVRNTAVTFEYDVPGAEEFRARMGKTLERYPYIVAEQEGEVVGYAYLSAFHERPAYGWCAETSIYMRDDMRRQGIGKKLYLALEAVAGVQNILNLNACVACPEREDAHLNRSSAQFHAHLGYRMVGEFHRCGYKFGNWYNMVWMEKWIGIHCENPPEIIPFPDLDPETIRKLLQQ